jgi:hypothetical protein
LTVCACVWRGRRRGPDVALGDSFAALMIVFNCVGSFHAIDKVLAKRWLIDVMAGYLMGEGDCCVDCR